MAGWVRSRTHSNKGLYHRLNKRLHIQTCKMYRLVELGKMNDPQLYEYYCSGQRFLHRVFGYRGIVLFHWTARLCDRDNNGHRITRSQWEDEGMASGKIKELKTERQTFYQVLIDNRDLPYIRTPPEAITLVADRKDKSIYSVPGLDYVIHEDILPFTANDSETFNHELLTQFFSNEDSQDMLSSWQVQNLNWLEHMEVHRETTRNIRVTVMPFYLGSKDVQQSTLHWWRYNIRLENLTGTRVQLKQRHWRIFSSNGSLETIKGEGVVGQQPVLSPSLPAFQYSSHVSLKASSGHMWGTFRMQRDDNKVFDIRVPPFNLEIINQ